MTAFYNDIEPFVVSWMRNLVAAGKIAPGDVDGRSIKDLTAKDLYGYTQAHFFAGIGGWSLALRRAGVPDDFPLWTGSCPCQPFSSAGARGGTSDPRHLWPAWAALIDECRPPIVFGEQVESEDGLAWLDTVYADLERCGYTVGAAVICAAGVGAPHLRHRIYFMAYTREGRRQVQRAPWLHDLRQPGDDDARRRAARGDAGALGNADALGREGAREPGAERTGRSEPPGDVLLADPGRARWGSRSTSEPGGALPAGRVEGAVHDQRRGADGDRALADASSHGWHEGAVRATGDGERSGDGGGMGDAEGGGRAARRIGRAPGWEALEPDGPGAPRAMGDASGDRAREHARELPGDEGEHEVGGEDGDHASVATGATRGFWTDAQWLPCIDGVSRPVEPGTSPLASGVRGRVGLLRGYGNSINIEVAVEFICAGLEACAQAEG